MANASFVSVAFEVVLLAGTLIVLFVGVVAGRNRSVWGPVAGLFFLLSAVAGLWQWVQVQADGGGLFFSTQNVAIMRSPMVVMDGFSSFAAILLGLVGFVAFLGSWDLQVRLGKRAVEFTCLMLLGLAGLHMMTATPNLVVIFIGLETASIAFYVLAAFTRKVKGSDEAGLKYFLLGSLASAMFLYGVALTFAATGSISLYGANSILDFLSLQVVTQPGILLAGLALMLVGLMFKISAAPFHQWSPDVYQGAPSGALGIMVAGVKIAGFVTLARIFASGMISQIDTWAPIIAVIAAISMVVGTVMALVQDDIKRLLAYSGVAHAGYILTAIVAGPDGYSAMWFYLATYAFMVVGAFAVVSVVGGPGSSTMPISSLKGLAKRSPETAWLMAVLMLGMSGMPFFAGFVGKLLAFVSAAGTGYLWLVVIGVLTTVIGLAFYLRIVATMFGSDDELGSDLGDLDVSMSARFAIIIGATVTLVFGVVPWPLLDVVKNALPL
jgi:NADH-quinone oxidoreductase subunit N